MTLKDYPHIKRMKDYPDATWISKMTSKCKRCGKLEKEHYSHFEHGQAYCYDNEDYSEKFIPEDVERYDVVYTDMTKEEKKKFDEKKGCVGHKVNLGGKETIGYWLECPSCSNQSPRVNPDKESFEAKGSGDKRSPLDDSALSKGTQTLSSKACKMGAYETMYRYYWEEDVKDFIENLKVEFAITKKPEEIFAIIDKLAGGKLSND